MRTTQEKLASALSAKEHFEQQIRSHADNIWELQRQIEQQRGYQNIFQVRVDDLDERIAELQNRLVN